MIFYFSYEKLSLTVLSLTLIVPFNFSRETKRHYVIRYVKSYVLI